jgi:3-hydroxyacyl-CoA dehydrogenase / enoyl-CoA hydratase / 3-hydroxybutyryl-CoA epimerase
MPDAAVYVLEKMAHGFDRLGRAHGAGFYDYEDGEPLGLWSGLKAFERRGKKIPEEDVSDRLLYARALQAVRCLEQGVPIGGPISDDPSPGSMSGALHFINATGVRRFVERSAQLADLYGERFRAPALLLDKAKKGETF